MQEDINEHDLLLAEEEEDKLEAKRRRRLLLLLLLLLLSVLCISALFCRYLMQPAPLPELFPLPVEINYSPHYLFSIYGVDKPVGVALSPQGDRLYVTETGGERLVKSFDSEGDPLDVFAPPRTGAGGRSPVYLDTDSSGRVFVTDRLQNAIFVYDAGGIYLDSILSLDLTLSEYIAKHAGALPPGTTFAYSVFEPEVHFQRPGEAEQLIPAPDPAGWSPLGVRLDGTDRMLLTNILVDHHMVCEIPAEVIMAPSWQEFDPPENTFGAYGQGDGDLLFPNTAVTDSQGRIYVSDGNNGRISAWDGDGRFLFHFGQGTGDGALNLPRGIAIDGRDRLYVVDAVGQDVQVYDVSEPSPVFLFALGSFGLGDGQFNYPNDIAISTNGRLYIADRENHRVQVWSY